MIEQSGRLLRKGEVVEFEGVSLVVDAGDSRRIHRVKIILPPNENITQENEQEE